jgi:hypothetical protein
MLMASMEPVLKYQIPTQEALAVAASLKATNRSFLAHRKDGLIFFFQ